MSNIIENSKVSSTANKFKHSNSQLFSDSDLAIAIINCQSITAKKASFNHFVSEHQPNVIAGCESWLSLSIASAEIFPTGYLIYRYDRSDGYGGVFVACQNTLTCEQLTFDTNVEIVVCCIKLREVPQPLIICAL